MMRAVSSPEHRLAKACKILSVVGKPERLILDGSQAEGKGVEPEHVALHVDIPADDVLYNELHEVYLGTLLVQLYSSSCVGSTLACHVTFSIFYLRGVVSHCRMSSVQVSYPEHFWVHISLPVCRVCC